MKLGIQTARLPGETLDEKFANAKAFGFDGVEVNVNPEFDLGDHVAELQAASASAGIPVCAICTHSIHDPLQPDAAEREQRFAGLTRLLELADELGAAGVVSVPVRRPVTFPSFNDDQLMGFANESFQAWASTLGEGRSAVFLEPLNRYEATFLRRVEQGIELAKAVNHPRVLGLADLFHMNIEESNMSDPILNAGALLGHVHIADNNRFQPGAGFMNLQPSFAALKSIDYTGFITIECSALGGPLLAQGPAAMLTETARYLREQWALA
jgi:sugar phosphate isomerase/epimerase